MKNDRRDWRGGERHEQGAELQTRSGAGERQEKAGDADSHLQREVTESVEPDSAARCIEGAGVGEECAGDDAEQRREERYPNQRQP